MDQFPDGMHVRLRSRERGTYLHADDDWVGVSLRPERASLNVAWRVHRVHRDGSYCVLLYSAAYGRYLAATDRAAPIGHRGQRVVQGVYDEPDEDAVVWKAVMAGDMDDVLLRHISYRLLRANGKNCTWNNRVSVDHYNHRSRMMQWVVEAIPPLPEAPIIRPAPNQPVLPGPPPRPAPQQQQQVHPRGGCFMGLFRRRAAEPIPEQRTIRFVRADANGNFNDNRWATFQFIGRSAYSLRSEVARQAGELLRFHNVTPCIRAGRYGRLTPVIADLPRNQEQMDIVALTAESPATQGFRYPDVHSRRYYRGGL